MGKICPYCRWWKTLPKQALEKAHSEYEKYRKQEKDRLSLVEEQFFESINKLEELEQKD